MIGKGQVITMIGDILCENVSFMIFLCSGVMVLTCIQKFYYSDYDKKKQKKTHTQKYKNVRNY